LVSPSLSRRAFLDDQTDYSSKATNILVTYWENEDRFEFSMSYSSIAQEIHALNRFLT
jgi:hypothetical protein